MGLRVKIRKLTVISVIVIVMIAVSCMQVVYVLGLSGLRAHKILSKQVNVRGSLIRKLQQMISRWSMDLQRCVVEKRCRRGGWMVECWLLAFEEEVNPVFGIIIKSNKWFLDSHSNFFVVKGLLVFPL